VIDRRLDFQWTPNIHEILSDVKKETGLSLHLDSIISRLGHSFINQAVDSIDPDAKVVILDNKQELNFDVLLITSGHTRSNYNIKGAGKHAFGFRSADEVIAIHNEIESILSNTENPVNINIIGGGFTGVEVLGELLRKYATKKQLHFTIIENGPRLVQSLPQKLADDILSQCRGFQVDFKFNQELIEVKKSSLHFSDKQSIKSDLTIWSAGTKLPDYLKNVNTTVVANGLAVNRYLQTEKYSNIFVAGDCATFTQPLAKQASIAMDMGMHAATNITRFAAHKTLLPLKVNDKPVLLSLGDINTYFVFGNLVLASPALASAKEAIYQLYMARLSVHLPIEQKITGIAHRFTLSTQKLLLAEILKLRPRVLLGRSKIL
jgi:NADH dehydrogenase